MYKLYYVNKKTDTNPNNNNEVHAEGCPKMPSPVNREYIGLFTNGRDAVAAAKRKGYINADGCYYCCPEAHRG